MGRKRRKERKGKDRRTCIICQKTMPNEKKIKPRAVRRDEV